MQKVEITVDTLLDAVCEFTNLNEFVDIIDKIVEKNTQYGDSWQQIGSFISFSDILDKLKRAIVYGYSDGMELVRIPQGNKFDEIIFDLWTRCLLLMMYRKELIKGIEDS